LIRYSKFALSALLLALTLALASCGGGGGQGADQGAGSEDTGADERTAQPAETTEEATGTDGMGDMEGMDHGSSGAGGMLMENGDYSDERFIDAMVPHHKGAVDMARVALREAEHPEIEQLAEDIVSTQRAEIEELKSIKKEEFGNAGVPMNMRQEDMRMMGMTMSPQELAKQDPFDKAFIDNMIPHHQSAIDMASIAQEESENPRIKELAEDIVSAQEREISQMQRWRQDWYPEG
jgi:uncharacterized protein (DUF305 family)